MYHFFYYYYHTIVIHIWIGTDVNQKNIENTFLRLMTTLMLLEHQEEANAYNTTLLGQLHSLAAGKRMESLKTQ